MKHVKILLHYSVQINISPIQPHRLRSWRCGRQSDRHKQGKERVQVGKITRVESTGCLAIGKAGKTALDQWLSWLEHCPIYQ